MTREFKIVKMMGLHAQTQNSVASINDQSSSYIACIGAGAAILPIDSTDVDVEEKFFYTPPVPGGGNSPGTSPRSSPRSSPCASPTLRAVGSGSPGSSSSRLVRVNKSHCLDVSSTQNMVAVGEYGGYLPRLLLYDLTTRELSDAVSDQHPYGVQFSKFSTSGSYSASLGTPQDGYLCIWSVQNGKLELKCSNRCISEVRDLVWLNNTQVVTVGVRHVKIWTVETTGSVLNGRNVILGNIANETFNCVLPISSIEKAEFLVGTQGGAVYCLPEPHLVISNPEGPIKSLSGAKETIFVSTASHIRTYSEKGPYDNPLQEFQFGSPASYTDGENVFCIETTKSYAWSRPLEHQCSISENTSNLANILYQKGLQLRSTRGKSILCWKSDSSSIVRWPSQVIPTNLIDITVADEADPSSLLIGSMSGDISLDGNIISAHNGPISDVHVFNANLCVSSGRDRTVQVWCREFAPTEVIKEETNVNQEGEEEEKDGQKGDEKDHEKVVEKEKVDEANKISPWILKQTLLFTTPILKVRLCEDQNKHLALVCCGANKTLYIYKTSDGSVSCKDDGEPAFADSPRTLLIKAMPYSLVEHGRNAILSTNDKVITILDPFGADLVATTWRPTDTHGDLTNLTHIDIFEESSDKGGTLLLGTSSTKSLIAYDLYTGTLIATLWGFGEPISGVASNGSEIVGSGDVVLVSQIQHVDQSSRPSVTTAADTPNLHTSTPMLNTPPSLQLPRLYLSRENMRASTSEQVVPQRPGSPGSPMRRVFDKSTTSVRSRSSSPVRSSSRRPNTSSATSGDVPTLRGSPPRVAHRAIVSNLEKPKVSSEVTLGPPLRMSAGSRNSLNSTTAQNSNQTIPSGLSADLKSFISSEQSISDSERKELKKLSIAALNKIDDSASSENMAQRIEQKLIEKISSL